MNIFAIEPLTLMISSRCNDKVKYQNKQQSLSKVRKAMKKELEGIRLGGETVFRVWIHEDEAAGLPADQNSWDTCVSRARKCDVFLMLFNGNAGWSGTSGKLGDHIGVCHAEFEAAYNRTPSKVRSVQFPPVSAKTGTPNNRFQKYFKRQGVIGAQVLTGEDAIEEAKRATISALLAFAHAGVGVGSRGSYYSGEALAWTRLDYHGRRKVTTEAVIEFLSGQTLGPGADLPENPIIYKVDGQSVAFICDCIPAAMSTAAARELVGQPFLEDFQTCTKLDKNTGGPVHLIACQKGVSEAQALRQLGFPDALIVSAPFGVYLADDVQKIQMVFIANCRDETSTRHHVQRFLRWMTEQGEDRLLAQRALSRRRICDQIAKEQKSR